jgi:uncharacterized lipoprotein YddW (UPF0748 family)
MHMPLLSQPTVRRRSTLAVLLTILAGFASMAAGQGGGAAADSASRARAASGQTPSHAASTSVTLAPLPLSGPLSPELLGNGVWWRPTFDEAVAEKVMSDLERWGYRNCFIESFWGGQTIFPSANFPAKTTDGKDWLRIFCEIGARHNVRVHAWIHTFYWQQSNVPLTSGTLVGDHPDWIEVSKTGKPAESGEKDSIFVSPAHPAVRHMLALLSDELCQRPIAGVNLDYIRYPFATPDFGYNPVAVERFRSETGIDPRSLTPDLQPDSAWMKWVAFRERMVTETVDEMARRIRENGTRQGRRITVSAAFFPGYSKERGRNSKFQNWPEWVRRGLLDFSTPMCYSPELGGLRAELTEVKLTHEGTSVVPLPGLAVGTFSSSHPSLKDQLKVVHDVGVRYYAVFKYETLAAELN